MFELNVTMYVITGTIFRLKGAIMNMSFLDCNGILIPAVADQWQEGGRDITRDQRKVCSMLP